MASKKCFKIRSNNDESIEVYICLDGIKDIANKIFKESSKEKKFKMIVEGIFRNTITRDMYEEYSEYPGTGTMKLSKGSDNYRIYCKIERFTKKDATKVKRIVLSRLHHKKDQKLSKKEINILSSIQNYDYEYKEWS